ncbi:MAG TPA: NADH-quinone oxidoreductase subunit F [Prolixibacteraceae bacterium]|nr:NADH-quinone oxidoreductase subunit F [Prolixibacteraceae bacterium]
MGKVANIIGASGLVGQQLLQQLLAHPEFEKVRSFVRRPSGNVHPKLDELVIDFDQPENWSKLVKGDVLFSSLGTTIKTAKTKENQYRVDFTYQYEFAKAAAENGVSTYVLVSSMGADARSSVFYSRMKGELEVAVSKLNFRKCTIFRPSILDGDRKEQRTGEKIGLVISRVLTRFILKKYRPTPVDVLAAKMINLSLDQKEEFRVIDGLEIFS